TIRLGEVLAEVAQVSAGDAGALQSALQRDTALLAKTLAGLGDRLPFPFVLVIDQCEEIFSLARTAEDVKNRQLALEMLRQMLEVGGDFKVILSLRTEYFGRLVDPLRQGDFFADGVREYLLTDFGEKQLVEAVLRPATGRTTRFVITRRGG